MKKINFLLIICLIICTSCQKEHPFDPNLKIIAYNIEYAKNTTPEGMADLLNTEDADIICFSEVPGQGWTKEVGRLLGLSYSYEGKIASANHTIDYIDITGNYYGKYKSILSRYPLKDTSEILLNGAKWSLASAVSGNITFNHASIQIFSLHIPTGLDDPINSEAELLSRIISESYNTIDKIILAGDFNDLIDSEPLKYLYDIGFYNSFDTLEMNLDTLTTFTDGRDDKVADHILYKGVNVVSSGIIEETGTPLSNHKPVWTIMQY